MKDSTEKTIFSKLPCLDKTGQPQGFTDNFSCVK